MADYQRAADARITPANMHNTLELRITSSATGDHGDHARPRHLASQQRQKHYPDGALHPDRPGACSLPHDFTAHSRR